MFRRLATILAILISTSCFSFAQDIVVVTFDSKSDDKPGIPIESKVERKTLVAASETVVGRTQDGRLEFHEPECFQAYYRLTPISQFLVRRDLADEFNWLRCDKDNPVVSVVHSTTKIAEANFEALEKAGVSVEALAVLKGQAPKGFAVPEVFSASYRIVVDGIAKGEPGASAKTADQLAAVYRKAGFVAEAKAFSEIAVGITAVSAWDKTSPDPVEWSGDLVIPSDGGSSAWVSNEGLGKLKEFQAQCGVTADGVIGWQTHGCLAGGDGFALPDEINNIYQAVDSLKDEPAYKGEPA